MALQGWLEQGSGEPGWWRGAGGVRAGWRAAMFLALLVVFIFAEALLASRLPLPRPTPGGLLTPDFLVFNEALLLVPASLASLIMLRLEGRGLAATCALTDACRLRRCTLGFAAGTMMLGVLVLALRFSGQGHLAWNGLGARDIVAYAVIWAAASLLIGFVEEFTFRGYLLQALSRGGVWPAIGITSLIFGAVHYSNIGEGLLGMGNAMLVGVVFALLIRRTGSLWASIGFHGGWDYGENFVFGAHDSGQGCAFSLLQLSPTGVPWLSGGDTGPEGSVLATGILAVAGLAVLLWRKKTPG